jgi:Zn ribbon nucleic-acid-binding protein
MPSALPYDVQRPCVKCGNAHIRDQHVGYFDQVEHIRRECLGCGYAWKELPLDHALDADDERDVSSFIYGGAVHVAASLRQPALAKLRKVSQAPRGSK